MNFYSKDINDWMGDTRFMNITEKGAYTEMVDLYFRTEKPLPLDKERLFRLVGAVSDLEKEAVITVRDELFVLTNDGWISDKLDEKMEKIYAKSKKARESVASRWSREQARKEQVDTNVLRTYYERNTKEKEKEKEKENTLSVDSLTESVQKPPKAASKSKAATEDYSPEFLRWWKVYPRKQGKEEAFAGWLKQKLESKVDKIIAHTTAMIESKQWQKDGGQWIPHGSTYISKKLFNDEIESDCVPTSYTPVSTILYLRPDYTTYWADIEEDERDVRISDRDRLYAAYGYKDIDQTDPFGTGADNPWSRGEISYQAELESRGE